MKAILNNNCLCIKIGLYVGSTNIIFAHYIVSENIIAPHLVIALPTIVICYSNSCRSFTLLKALAKSNGNLFAISFKSEKEQQLSLSQYWKFEWLDGTIIISYFGGSNNIFSRYILFHISADKFENMCVQKSRTIRRKNIENMLKNIKDNVSFYF